MAVDVDEVLYPFVASFLVHHNDTYETDHKFDEFLSYEFEHALGIDVDETIRRVYGYLETDHSHIDSLEGAKEAIMELSSRHDLYVVTARHPKFEESTKRWINERFGNVFQSVISIGYAPIMEKPVTKAEICNQLGAVALIDDSVGHVTHCAESGIEGVLFGNYPWNQTDELPERVTRCNDWPAVLEYFDGR